MLETTRNSFEIFLPRKKQKSPFQGKAFFSKKKNNCSYDICGRAIGQSPATDTTYRIDKGLGRPLLSKNFPLEVKLQGQL